MYDLEVEDIDHKEVIIIDLVADMGILAVEDRKINIYFKKLRKNLEIRNKKYIFALSNFKMTNKL